MLYSHTILKEYRTKAVNEKLLEISSYGFVITDMLHCMISCVITNTPCIAIDNISGKIGGVYEWIKSNGGVMFCEDAKNINDYMIDQMLSFSEITNRNNLGEEIKKLEILFSKGWQ